MRPASTIACDPRAFYDALAERGLTVTERELAGYVGDGGRQEAISNGSPALVHDDEHDRGRGPNVCQAVDVRDQRSAPVTSISNGSGAGTPRSVVEV